MWRISKPLPAMQKRLIELHLQRGRLLERISTQRTLLARQVAPLRSTFNLPDRIAVRLQQGREFVRQHPLVMTLAVASLVVLRPAPLLRWTQRGLVVWKTWRSLRHLVPAFVWERLRAWR